MAELQGLDDAANEGGLDIDRHEVEIGPVISELASEIGSLLATKPIFVRDGIPTVVSREGSLQEMVPLKFCSWVEQYIEFFQVRGEKRARKSLAADTAAKVLCSDAFLERLREIRRVNTLRMPVRRESGGVELLREGYDARTGIYTRPLLEYPADWSLSQAVRHLKAIYQDFPFIGEGGECVQVAAMLAMFSRELMPRYAHVPAFIFNANKSRSGKTLLAKMCCGFASGQINLQALPRTDDKQREMLNTAAIASYPHLLVDNIEGFFNSPDFNAFLTAPTWQGRRMHRQQDFNVEVCTTVCLTGNGFSIGADIQHRALVVDLFVDEADPHARAAELGDRVIEDDWILADENRADMCAAVWALIRHWAAEGCPGGDTTLADFSAFSRVVGGIVMAAGWPDPMVRREMETGGNQESADFARFLDICVVRLGLEEIAYTDILKVVRNYGLFEWVISPDDEPLPDDEFDLVKAGEGAPLDHKLRKKFGELMSRCVGGSDRGLIYRLGPDQTEYLVSMPRARNRRKMYFELLTDEVRTRLAAAR